MNNDQFSGLAFDPDTEVHQIDMTPTLASLLGLPIPQNNLGVIIPSALHWLPMRKQLSMLHSNTIQLTQVYKQNFPNYEKGKVLSILI